MIASKSLVLHRARGVTLIELLIVVAIMAILGTIAVNSYRAHMLRSNRTDAKMSLLRIQTAQEKFFLQNNTYSADLTAAPPAGLGVGTTTASGYYNLTVGPDPGTTNSIASSYFATATATGGQTQDKAACLVLTINDRGQRSPPESTGCWK